MSAEIERLVVRLEGDLTQLRSTLAAGVQHSRDASQAMASSFHEVGGAIEHVTSASELMSKAIGALTVGAMVEGARHALEYVGSLMDVAVSAGVSAESLQKLRYAAAELGLSNEQLDGALTKLNKNIGEASIKGGDAEKKFDRLGITLKELRANTPEENFYRVIDALGKVQDVTERTALSVDIFGKQVGRNFGKVIEATSEGVRQLGDEAQRTGAVLSDELAKKADEANDKLKGLSQTLKTQLTETMIALAPAIVTVTSGLAEFTVGLKQAFSPDYSALGKFANEMADTKKKIDEIKGKLREPWIFKLLDPEGFEYAKEQIANLENNLAELAAKQKAAMGLGVRQYEFVGPPPPPRDNKTEAQIEAEKKANEKRLEEKRKLDRLIQASGDALYQHQLQVMRDGEKEANEIEAREKVRDQAMRQSAELQARLAAGVIHDFLSGKSGVSAASAEQAQRVQEEQQQRAAEFHTKLLLRQLKDADADTAQLNQIAKDGEDELTRIKQEGADARKAIHDAERNLLVGGTQDMLSNLSSLMSTHSRKAFEIGKVAAISNATIATIESAVQAYKAMAGIPIVGPALGVAAAAAALAAGYANVQKIASTSYGGGGGAGGGYGAAAGSSSASAGTQQAAGAGAGQGISVYLSDQGLYSGRQLRNLIDQINSVRGDGSRVTIATGAGY